MISTNADLVRQGWRALSPQGDALAGSFLERLAALSPATLELFGTTSGSAGPAERAALLATVDDLVAASDEPRRLVAAGALLARRAPRPPTDAELGLIAELFLASVRDGLGDAFTRDAHDAWAEACTLLTSIERRARASGAHRAAANGNCI